MHSTIRTPDQRLRVFISSTLQELAPERAAVRRAVASLHLVPVMFELGARPHPPRDLYRAYLDQSHVFVGIYWQRYGWTAPDMEISGLEDEWALAGDRPKLVYLKEPAPEREPSLQRLLDKIRDDGGVSYRPFADAGELAQLVEDDLAVLLTERFEAAVVGPHVGSGDGGSDGHELPAFSALPSPPSPLVGRELEVHDLTELLGDGTNRLVTITGPGGCGKTRLALHVGELAGDRPNQRVCFVDLSGLRDPTLVLPTMAGALGVKDAGDRALPEAIGRVLGSASVLLVVDNFEHLVPAATDLAAVLEATTGLQVLVTSREALRLRWEQEYPLHPLATPEPGDGALAVAGSPAVELFVQFARRVRPSFELTSQDAATVGELVRRLDGLPLALELAAARLRVLSPVELLERLGRRLDDALGTGSPDAPARHRTLSEAMTWSYELLDPVEQATFRRLAAFAGGCTFDAAEIVCTGDGVPPERLLDVLDSLVDKSLVVARAGTTGPTRFHLLETARAFGRDRLRAEDEIAPVCARHLAWCTDLARGADEGFMGPAMQQWLDTVEAEHDNVRAALDHAESNGDAEAALTIAGLVWPWDIRGHLREGMTRLRAALALEGPSSLARGKALDALGWLTALAGDFDTARALMREGLAQVRAHGDTLNVAWSLGMQGMVAFNQMLADEADALFSESRDLAERAGDHFLAGWGLFGLAHVALLRGDLDQTVAGIEEALELGRVMDVPWGEAWARFSLGVVRILRGEPDLAAADMARCLRLRSAIGDTRGQADCLSVFAALASDRDDPAWAARLQGVAEVQRDASGLTVLPWLRPMYDSSVATLTAALGADGLATEWAAGRALPVDKAIAEVLADHPEL